MRKRAKLVLVREPSGRPSRSAELKEFPPTAVKRLRDAALAGMSDAEWGTELGRLFLNNRISAPQYAAGKRWALRAMQYQHAILAERSKARAQSFVRAGHTYPPDPDSEAGQEQARKDASAIANFTEAHAILLGAGLMAERAVRSVCEDEQILPGAEWVASLNRGLLWLAQHWGLTDDRKSQHVR